jgi:hypothetical protein
LVALVGTSVSARPAPSFTARASAGEVGGTMLIKAKVKHREKGKTFSAVADITFPDGSTLEDQALVRKGRSFVARTRVEVPDTTTPGMASIVVTVDYGGVETVLAPVNGKIVLPEEDDEDGDEGGEDDVTP